MDFNTQPIYFKLAIASVASSVVLMTVPFASATWPLAPFILLNWVLFMATVYFAFCRPFQWRTFVERPGRKRLIAVNGALLAFAICSWIALFNAQSIVVPNDLELRRANALEKNR